MFCDWCDVTTSQPVSTEDGVITDICPEYSLLEYSESQWVGQLVLVDDQGAPTATLHIDTGERVQLRVDPVEALVEQI